MPDSHNPWLFLPDEPPYVLSSDLPLIEKFNARGSEATRIETALVPEPFVGRLDAPIILLALNPGVSDGDFALHEDPAVRGRIRACHRQEPSDWPYYYLDPDMEGPGAAWSRRVLGPLIRATSLEAVAHNVGLYEWLPYHSRRFAHTGLEVDSQRFTRDRLVRALGGAAAVFVTRGRRLWETIPALDGHPLLFSTRSVQNITISPGNCPEGWDRALAALA